MFFLRYCCVSLYFVVAVVAFHLHFKENDEEVNEPNKTLRVKEKGEREQKKRKTHTHARALTLGREK